MSNVRREPATPKPNTLSHINPEAASSIDVPLSVLEEELVLARQTIQDHVRSLISGRLSLDDEHDEMGQFADELEDTVFAHTALNRALEASRQHARQLQIEQSPNVIELPTIPTLANNPAA